MRNSFAFTYILLTVAQMILSNYFHFTPYMMMTILPVMVLCIPTKTGTIQAMLIAFATGLAVDFFAEGTLGINAMSLVPVALLRRPVIGMFFGNEPFEQKENVTVRKYGFARVSLAIILMTTLFLLVHHSRLCRNKAVLVHRGKSRTLGAGQLPCVDLHHQPADL